MGIEEPELPDNFMFEGAGEEEGGDDVNDIYLDK